MGVITRVYSCVKWGVVAMYLLAGASSLAAQEYTEIYIWPPNVGVFAVQKSQQFEAWGVPAGGGNPIDLTSQVDWYLEANPFPAVGNYPEQELKPDDVAAISQNGLVTIKSSWGRVNVACCYPKGCADSIVQPPVIVDNPALNVITSYLMGPKYPVEFTVGQGGMVYDTYPGKLECDNSESDCVAEYREGSGVTFKTKPERGYDYGTWSGDCGNGGNKEDCTLTIDQEKSSGASFVALTGHRLTTNVGSEGGVSGTIGPDNISFSCTSEESPCTATIYDDETVVLRVRAERGYLFNRWTGCDETTVNSCSLKVNGDETVGATFTELAERNLTVNVTGGGSLSTSLGPVNSCDQASSPCSGSYYDNELVTLTANSIAGYDKGTWGGGCSGSAETPCTLEMDQAKTVNLTFAQLEEYGVTVSVSSGNSSGRIRSEPLGISCGNGNSDCTESFFDGESVTLIADPASGYGHGTWSGGGCSGSTATSCSVTVNGQKNISASFVELQEPVLTVTVNAPTGAFAGVQSENSGCGLVSPGDCDIACAPTLSFPLSPLNNCSETYSFNEEVSLDADFDGVNFVGWSGDCVGNNDNPTKTDLTMDGDKHCIATFN